VICPFHLREDVFFLAIIAVLNSKLYKLELRKQSIFSYACASVEL
jgi:hypothetical protein